MIPARLLFSLASAVLSEHIPRAHDALAAFLARFPAAPFSGVTGTAHFDSGGGALAHSHVLSKRSEVHGAQLVLYSLLIPVLVLLSGVFAGLTLGYMSLDETQLNVLSISGNPRQREYASKIKPIRKNGHMLLVTLLLANMIANETLPIIADPLLGGGFQGVVVSTVLIVIFAEIIPQSICTRHGLYIGAKMAGFTRILMILLGVFSWPISKLLELTLGPHHGIIYRRAELKELIAMHSSVSPLGGDLRSDTVTIIGAALDLQDKTVTHAMTPISEAFMLHIDEKLDYDTLRRICATGHSRIPVYEEVEVTVPQMMASRTSISSTMEGPIKKAPVQEVKIKAKKIIGILLVKQCVLLDPEDAIPVRKMRLNKVHFVPQNEPLLGILDRFQEGRSHMAIVSRLSREHAESVKKAVKTGLTQRLRNAVTGDSSSSDSSSDGEGPSERDQEAGEDDKKDGSDSDTEGRFKRGFYRARSRITGRNNKRGKHRKRKDGNEDLELGDVGKEAQIAKKQTFGSILHGNSLEQSMPADAVLSKANVDEYLQTQGIDPAIMPLGIITLEDVLEELIGEEIYDEFDVEGTGVHSQSYVPPGVPGEEKQLQVHFDKVKGQSTPELVSRNEKGEAVVLAPAMSAAICANNSSGTTTSMATTSTARSVPLALQNLRNLGFLRSRSAPPTPENAIVPLQTAVNEPVPKLELSESHVDSVATVTAGVGSPDRGQARGTEASLVYPSDTPPPADVGRDGLANASAPALVMPWASSAIRTSTITHGVPGAKTGGRTPPRSASPGPALEAILLERRRRAHAVVAAGAPGAPSIGAATGGASGMPALTVTPAAGEGSAGLVPGVGPRLPKPKGGFKSSPLSAPGMDTDVGESEKAKKQGEGNREDDGANNEESASDKGK